MTGTHRPATERTVIALAPHATGRIVEWIVYDCGCVYRAMIGISDVRRYVGTVMEPAAPDAVEAAGG